VGHDQHIRVDPTGDDLGRGAPGRAAQGRGPNRGGKFSQEDDRAPAAGWGAAISAMKVLGRTREAVRGPHAILKMNHENGGFDCPGCAWPDDRNGLHLDICENGIKHVCGGLRWGVKSICAVLSENGASIAPSTYYEARSRTLSARDERDEQLKKHIRRVHRDNYGVLRRPQGLARAQP
jgi:hypothetical protein